ncbi:MAG: zinc-ribbon domain-containing protein [Candidatus Lokiarchaeota archaeon]|nr:zinc-ribbon domain-containing protein [Candidatus Lokiarchaeota archaeon]
MAKFCPYCGNPVKPNDKYCIICGKPLLADISKKAEQEAERKMQEDIEEAKKDSKSKKEKKKEEGEDEKDQEINLEEEEEELEEGKKEKKKKDKKEKEEEEVKEVKPLPEEVKHQIELYADYSDLQFNKETLKKKLEGVSNMMKDEKYDYDFNYKQKVNIKLKAVKTLINELKEKEKQIESKMDDIFIIQKLNNELDAKVYQLKNLTRQYRLKKVDKNTFEKLKKKYKSTKEDIEQQLSDLRDGMNQWIQELKMEENDLVGLLKLNKGRYSSKEIEEDEYKKTREDLEFKLKKVRAKIDTLEKLTK